MKEILSNIVSVICLTYNQSSFVKETMNGFCMQQTKFPFLCIIVDDASTDGEQNVLMDYVKDNFDRLDFPNFVNQETDDYATVLARHKSNGNCFFIVYFLKYNHFRKKDSSPYYAEWINRSKYVAYCEGDDFWIDPLKLQKQYDIFESDKNVSLVYTGFRCVDENGEEMDRPYFDQLMKISKTGDLFYDMLKQNFIMTLTTCFKKEIIQSTVIKDAPYSQDYLYTLFASAMGKVVYIPDRTGCYRFVSNSLSNSRKKKVYETNQHIGIYLSKLYLKGDFPQREKKMHKKIRCRIIWNRCLFLWYLFKMKIKRFLCFVGMIHCNS